MNKPGNRLFWRNRVAKTHSPVLGLNRNTWLTLGLLGLVIALGTLSAWCATSVYLTGVPDYNWNWACMGTAAGNLMGFWDRHGMSDFYTGPSYGGVAPLAAPAGPPYPPIVSMWASQAGLDGRPANQPGHVDDYYVGYESVSLDPYVTAGRPEHAWDCLGDFIGMDQLRWTNLANECAGNIDGFCFVYWDTNGARRVNFDPTDVAGNPTIDVQWGLRKWARYRGYDAEVFTQLTDFNPDKPLSAGFTLADLKAEIDAGYPVLLFLQSFTSFSRTVNGVPGMNPEIHSMLAYGYYTNNSGVAYVRYRTSWASGDNVLSVWGPQNWQANMPVRGVIGFHPRPKIRRFAATGSDLFLQWDGPAADLYNSTLGTTNRVHGYLVEMSTSLDPPNFSPVSPVLLTNSFTVSSCPSPAYFRVELVRP